ncbi:hypothetical protein [Streptomyces malaysiensis]|uniref:Uncharacterized protein n=1 Tax=Streptomyces malaysiensis subsp. samsunensis TaxID=459658 RepID=A0A9X2LY99_STRMQ|nr:hypothetical protein [Streptomyces samsunensis]MCQ8832201.1 hypothetical protein [Streptomyces samsunensis]
MSADLAGRVPGDYRQCLFTELAMAVDEKRAGNGLGTCTPGFSKP